MVNSGRAMRVLPFRFHVLGRRIRGCLNRWTAGDVSPEKPASACEVGGPYSWPGQRCKRGSAPAPSGLPRSFFGPKKAQSSVRSRTHQAPTSAIAAETGTATIRR